MSEVGSRKIYSYDPIRFHNTKTIFFELSIIRGKIVPSHWRLTHVTIGHLSDKIMPIVCFKAGHCGATMPWYSTPASLWWFRNGQMRTCQAWLNFRSMVLMCQVHCNFTHYNELGIDYMDIVVTITCSVV